MAAQTLKEFVERQRNQLKLERQSFETHWKDLADHVLPRRSRFFSQDRNRGDKGRHKHNIIINSHASWALRVARAGLFAGTMSPTIPWFNLETVNIDLMESNAVKRWLHRQEKLIRAILNQSNFYNMAPVLLEELLLFGTGCMTHVEDFQDVSRFFTHTVGSYMIAQNERYEVTTLIREFEMTTEQMVRQFGEDKVSDRVKSAWDKGDLHMWWPVVHYIDPNPDADPTKLLSQFKPFRSLMYEPGTDRHNDNKWLHKGGFDEFPAYSPRWDVTGEDIYGTNCPGMSALGDIRTLQIQEKRKAQAVDKLVNPPLKGPSALRNVPVTSLPGGLNIYDSDRSGEGLQPVYQINPSLQDLRFDMDAVERRIDQAFFVDLFLAISNMEGIQPRNQLDLSQRNQERLLQLGPVLERVNNEFLAKLIDRVFNQGIRTGIIRNAPPELQGQELNVRFISTLAQAQRTVATAAIERLSGFVATLMGSGFETVALKFDAEQAVDEYAQSIGASPTLIVADEDVQQAKEQIAQQQQQQVEAEQAQQGADTVKKLSEADATQRGR